jgi:putative flavoprotein involved in K+ transport
VSFDLNAAGVTTVIWCTGYRYEFDWVRLPIFDEQYQPVQNRGVTSCPGAYFVGLHWMHKYTSGTLFGVGEDAAYIAQHITSRSSRT